MSVNFKNSNAHFNLQVPLTHSEKKGADRCINSETGKTAPLGLSTIHSSGASAPHAAYKEKMVKKSSGCSAKKVALVAGAVLLATGAVASSVLAYHRSSLTKTNYAGCVPYYTEGYDWQYSFLERFLCQSSDAGLALESVIIDDLVKQEASPYRLERLSPSLRNNEDYMRRLISRKFDAIDFISDEWKRDPKRLLPLLKELHREHNAHFRYLNLLDFLPYKDNKDFFLQVLPLLPDFRLSDIYNQLSLPLQNDEEIALALIDKENEFRILLVDTLCPKFQDSEKIAYALYKKDSGYFHRRWLQRFSKQVQGSETLWANIFEHVVQSTQPTIERMQKEETSQSEWDDFVEGHWKLLLDLPSSKNSKEASLKIIEKFPGDFDEIFYRMSEELKKDRDIAIAVLDACEASSYYQLFEEASTDNSYTLRNIARTWGNDAEIAARAYQQSPSLLWSFRDLRNDKEFLATIKHKPTKLEDFILPEHCQELDNSVVKSYLKEDLRTRISHLNPTCKHKKSPQAQLMMFNQVAKTDQEARAMLKEFEKFKYYPDQLMKQAMRKVYLQVHPDKSLSQEEKEKVTPLVIKLQEAFEAYTKRVSLNCGLS